MNAHSPYTDNTAKSHHDILNYSYETVSINDGHCVM